MSLLRSLAFNVFFYSWTTVIVTAGLPLLLGPRSGLYHLGRLWVRVTMTGLALICGLRYEVRGLERLPKGAFLVAAKHQSAWDTMIFSLLLWEHSFILKQELTWIPLFGLFLLRAGLVPVDRQGGSKALRKMIAKAKAVAADGRPLVIFPEGTRVAPGERRPYHPGVAALYGQLDISVVPVALNSGLFWGRRSFMKRPGTILLEFLPKIDPGLNRKDFLQQLEATIEGCSTALAQEAAPALRQSMAQPSG